MGTAALERAGVIQCVSKPKGTRDWETDAYKCVTAVIFIQLKWQTIWHIAYSLQLCENKFEKSNEDKNLITDTVMHLLYFLTCFLFVPQTEVLYFTYSV